MSKQVGSNKRIVIESIEAVNARFELEDWQSVTRPVSLKLIPGEKLRLSRRRRRWITPMMRGLAALSTPTEGSCLINGLDIANFTFEEFNSYRANIGFGFSAPNLISNRTLRDNLMLPVLYNWEKTPAEALEMVAEISEFFVISSFLKLRPSNVPPGICKIVGVARAFMRDPSFVFLDDPFVGLEKATAELLVSWLAQLLKQKPQTTVLIASNDDSFDQRLGLSLIKTTESHLYDTDDTRGAA